MQEKPRDPFFGPETAAEEIDERIHVLCRQANREREEASRIEAEAERLRESANKRDHIVRQYRRLVVAPHEQPTAST